MKTLMSASRLHMYVCACMSKTHAYTQRTHTGKSETVRSHAWDTSICEVEAGGLRGHS